MEGGRKEGPVHKVGATKNKGTVAEGVRQDRSGSGLRRGRGWWTSGGRGTLLGSSDAEAALSSEDSGAARFPNVFVGDTMKSFEDGQAGTGETTISGPVLV